MTPAVEQWLRWLHPGDAGFRDIRAISSDRKTSRQFFFPLDEFAGIDKFSTAKFTQGLNLFTGVAIRANEHGGQLKDCSTLHHLFVDLDFKAVSEQEARDRIARFPHQPSCIVATGGGLHVYWTLLVPIDLSASNQAAYAKAVLRALAAHLNADLGAATPERILRIPETLNHKYSPPAVVTIEVFEPDHTTALAEILEVIGPVSVAVDNRKKDVYKRTIKDEDRVKQAQRWLARQEPAVEGQGGDQHTFNICCAVAIGFDLAVDLAITALQEWNARCDPPWNEKDLKLKLGNAEQYGDQSTRGGRLRANNRNLSVESLSSIKPRPVHWMWNQRIPMGALSLLAGREGIGKSMLAYQLVADITQGRLPGKFFGTSKAVIVAATEDSYEHTIVPRLMAAGANLNKIYRVAVESNEGTTELILPKDVQALEALIMELDVALVLLDPVISRLDRKLDSHKDADVRAGLEPISRIAHDTNCVVLGIIHVNKGSATDPMNMIMGSRAFAAIARTVLFVMTDPEDPALRMVGTPKNNVGRTNLPSLLFTIEDTFVMRTDEGDVHSGKLVWKGETERSLTDELETANGEDKNAVMDTSEWLRDFLTTKGGFADSKDIKAEAKKAGHAVSTIHRARKRIQVAVVNRGTWPRVTYWCLKGHTPPEDEGEQIAAPF